MQNYVLDYWEQRLNNLQRLRKLLSLVKKKTAHLKVKFEFYTFDFG